MFSIKPLPEFTEWLGSLKDGLTKRRLVARLHKAQLGNLGDTKPVGQGISELRIDHGPGYRIYFMKRGSTIIILLCGGDKSSQTNDIQTAKRLAAEWSKEND